MSIGVPELIVILVCCHIFFSPEQIAQFAEKLGKAMKAYREGAETLSVPINEVKDTLNEVKQDLADAVSTTEDTANKEDSNG